MPRLNNRNPKLSKLRKYAVAYYRGKIHYLGLHGTPEALTAYNRFCAEIQENPTFITSQRAKCVTVRELTAAFLDHAAANTDSATYSFFRVVALDFLDVLYGDNFPVDDFTPRCLKLVRDEMIKSRRYCRRILNRCVKSVIAIFSWGVEHEMVKETTWSALKAVKPLQEGHYGTFDHEERQPVPDDVVRRTLPFLPPTVQAMIKLQRILGMRPNEIFLMRVGDIDTTRENGLWYYLPGSYKTSRHVGKIVFPLGKPEQELIAPYLEGKNADNAVFSPRQAMAERNAERAANRKTKPSPSHMRKAEERAKKPSYYAEFYNRDSYRQAIEHAICTGNKAGQAIPKWTPYMLRNSAATAIESEIGLDEAQAQLGHKTADMTRRYSKAQLRIREALARKRVNPFEAEES